MYERKIVLSHFWQSCISLICNTNMKLRSIFRKRYNDTMPDASLVTPFTQIETQRILSKYISLWARNTPRNEKLHFSRYHKHLSKHYISSG